MSKDFRGAKMVVKGLGVIGAQRSEMGRMEVKWPKEVKGPLGRL